MSSRYESRKKYLSDALGIPTDQINDDTVEYYYTKFPNWCCQYEYQPMFPGIKPYDYLTPIQNLSKYFSTIEDSSYFTEFAKKMEKSIGKSKHNKQPLKQSVDYDQVMLQYLKCRPQTKVLTVWPNVKLNSTKVAKFIKFLQGFGHVYYHKEISCDYAQGRGIVYQLYADTDWVKTIRDIERDKTDWVGFTRQGKQTMNVFVFENTSGRNLIGTDADLKMEFRAYLGQLGEIENEKRLKHVLHINDFNYQTVEYAQLYFCENSLKMLSHQNLEKLMSYNFRNCRIFLNTFKQWLIKNFSSLDQNRYCLASSVVLYTYGLRSCGDLDVYITGEPVDSDTDDFYQRVVYFLLSPYQRRDKLKSIIQSLEKNNEQDLVKIAKVAEGMYFIDSWIGRLFRDPDRPRKNRVYQQHNIPPWDEIVLNPEEHYYYMGLKIINLENLIKVKAIDFISSAKTVSKKSKRLSDFYYLDKNDLLTIPKIFNITKQELTTVTNQKTGNSSQIDWNFMLQMVAKKIKADYGNTVDLKTIEKFVESKILGSRRSTGQGRKSPKKKNSKKPKRKSPKRQSSEKRRAKKKREN